jgi:hypothetical protein
MATGTPGYKRRCWQAFIYVSASGPEFNPEFENHGYTLRPRLAADLRYTTADVEFMSQWWSEPHYDSGACGEFHAPQLKNPSHADVLDAIRRAGEWLAGNSERDDWDGGHLTFTFAGHGRDSDGALVLTDGLLTAEEFTLAIVSVAQQWSSSKVRLRLVMQLDSCYSGAFLLRVLHAVISEHDRLVVPYYLAAAAMPDEVSWEESTLGHGVFTYCESIHQRDDGPPFAFGALAVQPDNTYGPSLFLARGAYGCALLTCGEQNPIVYSDYELQACGDAFSVFASEADTSNPIPELEMKERLLAIRDDFKRQLAPLRKGRSMRGQFTDDELKAENDRLLAFILRVGLARNRALISKDQLDPNADPNRGAG